MKKLFLILITILFTFPLFAQEPEPELSDYEKYRIEKEKELYQTDEEVFYIVEDMPKFQGKDGKEFRKYITENVRYPQEAVKNNITGKVIVSFVVDKSGEVINAKIEKSIDPYLDAEAIRVVESSPKWIAGKQRGEAVKVQFTFPINFVLDAPDESETVIINNYNDYTQPNYRFLLTFGYHYPYYSHYYDPFYYGYNSYYYGSYYPYWGYNRYYSSYYGYNNYYGHNYYNYGNSSRPYRNGKYTATNALGWNRNYYRSYQQNVGSSRTAGITSKRPVSKSIATRQAPIQQSATRQQTTRTNGERSTYTPRYQKPTTIVRQSYNRNSSSNRQTTATQKSSQQRSTYVRPAQSQTRTYNRPSSSAQRSSSSYRAPSSAPSRSYSAPSRSSSSYSSGSSGSRSSGSASRSSGSRSSGSASRSSGGSRR